MTEKQFRRPWKGTMTRRERFLAQMNYRAFDRTVNMEFGYWAENYQTWDIFVKNGVKNEAEADRFFSLEPPLTVRGKTWLCPPFERRVVEDRGDKEVILDVDGLYLERPKDGHSTIPKYLRSSVETPEDWKRVKEEHFDRRHPGRAIDFARLDRLCADDRTEAVGVYTGSMIGDVRNLLTLEGLAYAVCDYPDMVEDMVETACLLVEDWLDAVLPRYRFDYAAGWEDICCKNGPLVNMDFFRSVVVPRYRRIGDKLHKYGVHLWYTDCDGDVRYLIPDFLDVGINCLFPYEVNSCVHPARLLEEYGGELRLMGGFDKMQMIAGKDAIKSYMKSIEPWVARGGYIPFCDHRCPPDVTPENYLYYLDLKEATFGLK
ncbi:MAG: hypothetical protein J6125_00750 [Clostridia bacterium]|nr:hypothetical protein [Clostridia bacterium]